MIYNVIYGVLCKNDTAYCIKAPERGVFCEKNR